MSKGHWGIFSDNTTPEIRFDPFQSFSDTIDPVGFRVSINPSRGQRPREHKKTFVVENQDETSQLSLLQEIMNGKFMCIPISGDRTILQNYDSKPDFYDLSSYRAITIINKFPALNYQHFKYPGVSLVSFSSKYTEHLVDIPSIYDILISLRTSISSLTNDVFDSSLIFFNIGRSSGASLKHLHAQAYVTRGYYGSVRYIFTKAAKNAREVLGNCLGCLITKGGILTDHLDQQINIDKLIVWQDKNVILYHPFAPYRPKSLRILLKRHYEEFKNLRDSDLQSVAIALNKSYIVLKETIGKHWSRGLDRSIAVREGKDQHLIIDILSTIPLGAAELVDSLSVTQFIPEVEAESMRSVL